MSDTERGNSLLKPRNHKEEELDSLLEWVFRSKIAADKASGEPCVNTAMVYGELPIGGGAAFLDALMRHQRYEFGLATEYREASNIDRLATLFSGPFYTSVDYPWPDRGQGYLEPLFQVDLDLASRVAGATIGEGLIQIWMDDGDAFVRHVPRSAVSRSELAPIPTEGKWVSLVAGRNVYSSLAADSGEARWVRGGHQVVGVGRACFSPHQMIRRVLEEELIDQEERYAAELVEGARRCLELIEIAQSGNERLRSSTSASLFGNYYPMQYDAGVETVLLNYQADEVLRFGGGDQDGIIFYDAARVGRGFSFEREA